MLVINQVAGNPSYNRQSQEVHCPEVSGCPGGDTKARHMVKVPGATLDAHRLHAVSVLFCKCGLPPYSRVVPVDASSHVLAM
jgi:hypothetical protein